MIDRRGRLFGKINIIDLGVLLIIFLLGYFAWQIYYIANYPAPVVKEISPRIIARNAKTIVRIYGENFDKDTVVSLSRGDLGKYEPTTYVSPNELEIEIRDSKPEGIYTLVVVNKANKMVSVSEAIKVTGRDAEDMDLFQMAQDTFEKLPKGWSRRKRHRDEAIDLLWQRLRSVRHERDGF
jgi:hypothetical protein